MWPINMHMSVHILAELELNLLLMKSLTWTCISKCEMRTLSTSQKEATQPSATKAFIHTWIHSEIHSIRYGIDSTRHNIKKVYENFDS